MEQWSGSVVGRPLLRHSITPPLQPLSRGVGSGRTFRPGVRALATRVPLDQGVDWPASNTSPSGGTDLRSPVDAGTAARFGQRGRVAEGSCRTIRAGSLGKCNPSDDEGGARHSLRAAKAGTSAPVSREPAEPPDLELAGRLSVAPARSQHADQQPDTKGNANGLVGMLPDGLVGSLGGSDRLILEVAV